MKINFKRGIGVMLVMFSVFVYAYPHLAQMVAPLGTGTTPASPPGTVTTASNPINKLDNPIKADSVEKLLFTMVDLAIFLGSIVAVFMFLWVGFKFVMARGNETEIKDAKQWFMYAVIGTAILISSKVIVSVVQNTLIDAGVVDKKAFTLPK